MVRVNLGVGRLMFFIYCFVFGFTLGLLGNDGIIAQKLLANEKHNDYELYYNTIEKFFWMRILCMIVIALCVCIGLNLLIWRAYRVIRFMDHHLMSSRQRLDRSFRLQSGVRNTAVAIWGFIVAMILGGVCDTGLYIAVAWWMTKVRLPSYAGKSGRVFEALLLHTPYHAYALAGWLVAVSGVVAVLALQRRRASEDTF